MGYRVHRLHSLVHLLHQTGNRVYRPVPATQPCTFSSRNWLQSVPTCTGYTALYTCFKKLATEFTDWYLLHRLVHLLQQLVTECTGRYQLLNPIKHALQSLQMHQKRVGRLRKRTHCKRHLVPSGKQVAYQLPRTQGSLSSLKKSSKTSAYTK